jgi:hypothetical protein
MLTRRPKIGDKVKYSPYGRYKETYTVKSVGENLLYYTDSKNIEGVIIWNFGDELSKDLEIEQEG